MEELGMSSLSLYLRETYAWFNKNHYFWRAWLAIGTNHYAFFFTLVIPEGVEIPSLWHLVIFFPISFTYTAEIKAVS